MAPLADPAYALAWYGIPTGGCGVIRTSSRRIRLSSKPTETA
jgi:hypothetical protein